ncbi:MAG: PspC domain-containing protein [Candidatus Bipolaricaulota bacterium]|nr:PspC domain-containing protein [Candidatus Bipolaricaulota bacterium]
MKGKLYRSRTDSMLAGVCGGLGNYFGIDSSIVRIVFVLLALVPPCLGLLVYLAMWLIVPREGVQTTPPETVRTGAEEIAEKARAVGEDVRTAVRHSNVSAGFVVGGVLIALGVILLLSNLGFVWSRWLGLRILWPILLVIAGLALLLRRPRRDDRDG